MIKKTIAPIVGILVLAFNISAQADVITCVFTEPFVNTTYDLAKQTLTVEQYEGKLVVKDVSFEIKSAGKFHIVSQDGVVLQKLDLNGKGSDGMSDTVFPYEVTDTSMDKFANNGIGGCYSNHLKSIPGDQTY